MRASLFRIDELRSIPALAEMIAAIDERFPALDEARRGAELVREVISYFIGAVVRETQSRIATALPSSVSDIRNLGHAVVAFPDDVAATETAIKRFLYERMYRHSRVMRIMGEAESVISDLFARYRSDPAEMPAEWSPAKAEGAFALERRIGDFIAGMTDGFALKEHERLFDLTPKLL